MFEQQAPLILASASRPRRLLLESLGLRFSCIPADVDEVAIKASLPHIPFSQLAIELACAKALAVSQCYPETYVIGADQLCVFDGRIFGKPLTAEKALSHLQSLQGQQHQQICAMCIARSGEVLWKYADIVNLWMRPLTVSQIESYLHQESPLQSCGAYHYEGRGKWLFERVDGSESSVQGLALQSLVNGFYESHFSTQ